MPVKTKIRWVFIFGLLSLFTYSTLISAFENRGLFLAHAAVENFSGSGNNDFIVIDKDGGSPSSLIKSLKNIFINLKETNICSVNEEELNLVSGQYQTEVQKIKIGNKNISITEIKNISEEELYKNLDKDNLDCKIIKGKNWFFLLFSPQLS